MTKWKTLKVRDFAHTTSGGTPSTSRRDFWGNGTIPWINSGELSQFDFIQKPTTYVTEKGLKCSSAKLFPEETVVVALTGATTGMVAHLDIETATNQSIVGIFPNETLDSLYLFYYLSNNRAYILSFNVGSAQEHINKRIVDSLDIVFPEDLKEQSKIAQILFSIDRAIAQTEALIAKHQRVKTGLMQDLLTRGIDEHGQLRDPSTHKFVETEIGLLPAHWQISPLGKYIKLHNNLRKPISSLVREGMKGPYPYYGATGIVDYINEYRVDGKYVLIGEDGDHFLKFRKQEMTILAEGKFNVSNHAHIIEGTSKCLTEWIFQFFAHRDLTFFLTRQGAGRFKLNKKTLLSLPIALPEPEEQSRICTVLFQAQKNVEEHKRNLRKLHSLKTGLMQDLLSGRVSVSPLMEGQNPVNTENQKQTREYIDNVLSETQKEDLLVMQGKRQEIVIGVPHHAPLGVSNLPNQEHQASDETAGLVGAEVARLLDCNCVIACNTTLDPNKNKETDYSQQILSWKPRLLIEIHAHGGKYAKFDIEISSGTAKRKSWSLDLEARLHKKMAVEPLLKEFTVSGDFDKIYYQATKSYTITAREWVALHIELPKKIRESPEIYLPFCRILAEAVAELMENFDSIAKP